MVFVSHCEMTNIITKLHMLLNGFYSFLLIISQPFLQESYTHWQQVLLIPLNKLRTGFHQTIRLRLYINMNRFAGCFLKLYQGFYNPQKIGSSLLKNSLYFFT